MSDIDLTTELLKYRQRLANHARNRPRYEVVRADFEALVCLSDETPNSTALLRLIEKFEFLLRGLVN